MNSVNSAIPLTNIYIYVCVFLIDIISIIILFVIGVMSCVIWWRWSQAATTTRQADPEIAADHGNSAGEALLAAFTNKNPLVKHSMIQQPKISKLIKTPMTFPSQSMFLSENLDSWSSFAQSHCWCRSWWRNNGRGSFLPWAGADPVAALHPRHLHPASWPTGSPLGKSHRKFPSGSNALCFLPLKHLVSRFS